MHPLRPPIPNRLLRLVLRLRAENEGAAAVEFGLVALPFIALIFAIIQTSLVLFATQALQMAVSDASRTIMTGEMAGANRAAFKAKLCATGSAVLFDCAKLYVQVNSFANFSSANPATFVNPDCFDPKKAATAACYSPGGAQQVVLVRVSYDWPFGLNLEEITHKRTLVALAAFRSEPY